MADVPARTIWVDPDDPSVVYILDQRRLPHAVEVLDLRTVEEMAEAIRDMAVRGAGCIGVSAGFGMYLAALQAEGLSADGAAEHLARSAALLRGTRPTAVNLDWAVSLQLGELAGLWAGPTLTSRALDVAQRIAEDDVERCRRIGQHGLELMREVHQRTGAPVQVLTHCNAGWLAFVEHGSATAPIYAAHRAGIPVHVWVGETRPRSQGALTAWELGQAGVPHTFVVDNAIGHLLQRGQVDLVITGADRVAANGDVANKIGTYLRALAAGAHDVPFYVAFPASTLDPSTTDGIAQIPIEERGPGEVTRVRGVDGSRTAVGARSTQQETEVTVVPEGTEAANPAFDVTPAGLITGLITDRGLCAATAPAIAERLGTTAARI
ncbi:S-methyl-5-thioribose-1-phosphate isomerase [Euzebya tangerina]|uniref:S-methyl-5-thioribose-1-phosphate isomerase n=1 Tax=Euzebya tangerina TaxID=591198 RepID=UPI000E314316|nr:S-methyl-5-thioribose-1-phosphate isomerase [Euzebya tangerina]